MQCILEEDGCKNASMFQGQAPDAETLFSYKPLWIPLFRMQHVYNRSIAFHSTTSIHSPDEYTRIGAWQASLVQRVSLLLPNTSYFPATISNRFKIWDSWVGKSSLWEQDDPSKMFAWLAVSWMRCKYRPPDSWNPSSALHLCSFKRDAKSCCVLGVAGGGLFM